ncbi:MAG: M48 family metallopeptidase [Cytophagaceae bacterium]|nr:M48 family metallopeptidase [Cytophagaceae bacterium]MDW8455288.1 M48 family metallopeptidase [Cytophagaceae bacterium]
MYKKAKYFDGKQTKPQDVLVSVSDLGFTIVSHTGSKIMYSHEDVNTFSQEQKRIIIKFGKSFPYQFLETDDIELLEEIKKSKPDAKYLRDVYLIFKKHGAKSFLVGTTIIITLFIIIYFYILPVAALLAVEAFPKHLEIELGKQIKENWVSAMKTDSTKTEVINKFYDELQKEVEYPIHITVVDEKNIKNAFALPGGEIVVFSAILDSMKSYHELTGLLGHEIGHVENRHTLKALMKSLSSYLFVSIVFQDYSGMLAVIAERAAMIEQLSHSREAESESDQYGYELILKNNGDPNGMISLFENLKDRHDSTASHIPEFLTTHPKLDKRIEEIRKKTKGKTFKVVKNPKLELYFQQLK